MTGKRLSKEEWNHLDKLLSKLGFGGYYDLVECLKQAIFDINSKTNMFIEKNVRKNTNLVVFVRILNRNAQKLKSVGLNYNRETSEILKERGLDLFSIKGAIKTKEAGE